MSQLLARRTYYRKATPERTELEIRLYEPLASEPGFYKCEYELVTSQDCRRSYIEGIDVFDVLLRAIKLLGSNVNGLNSSVYHRELRWEGDDSGGIGLPSVEDEWPESV